MPNGNEITTGKKTSGQFTVAYQQNGYGGCIPVIDGKPEPRLMFGYASETDKAACMKLIEEALKATNGNIFETQRYITNAAVIAANEIKPDEAVEIQGIEVLISYADKKAYIDTMEIANLEEITCEMPDEAVKALLISRVETEMERRRAEEVNVLLYNNDEDEDEEEYEDDYEDEE